MCFNSLPVDLARISELLCPFLGNSKLSDAQLSCISMYIDILVRWNARVNLTAVRDEENIVARHFGESLFAAQVSARNLAAGAHVVDVGSGAGFPGLPVRILAPQLHVTLIESNNKKVTFLREVIRALGLSGVDVFAERAENFPAASAELVTLRAVERFESILPTATRLVAPGGRLALLIGRDQVQHAKQLTILDWDSPLPLPGSNQRVLLLGSKRSTLNE
jgi:16S rRNA (guanine527-N7)-methyltransferase